MRKRRWRQILAMMLTAAMLLTGMDVTGLTANAEGEEDVVTDTFDKLEGWNPDTNVSLGTNKIVTGTDPNNKTNVWNIYNGSAVTVTFQKEFTDLQAGNYKASIQAYGGSVSGTLCVEETESKKASTDLVIGGWVDGSNDVWETTTTGVCAVAGTSLTVKITLNIEAGGWLKLDNFKLTKIPDDAAGEEEAKAKAEALKKLGDLLSECNVLQDADYKADSWAALQSEITAAQTVYDDAENKTSAEITTALNALQAAKDALVDAGLVENSGINVTKVEGITDDFIRGVDISTYASLIDSGVKFKGWDGSELDSDVAFFQLLKEAGVNYVRIRVWNDPYDADGNGYGAGNCDVDKACEMGKAATDAGLKVLIDFHYSDFWADPGRQVVPKAWKDYDIEQKASAVGTFTRDSLKQLLEAGVDVSMVQVGNETNGKLCGESNQDNINKLFQAGSNSVRNLSSERGKDILIAFHFTNPEKGANMKNYAKNLADNHIDYDVFASSYYPFWHGTPENLTSVLSDIATTYNKKVMVAETSWAYTLDDGDGQTNVVRVGNNDANPAYTFSVQGQANEVRAVIQAVKNVGDAGIGMFYWEPAWLPVNVYDEDADNAEEILAKNQQAWDEFGSGWASIYSIPYDPNVTKDNYGGSEWDNQAMFDFNGNPLPSLNVFKYVKTGSSTPKTFDTVINPETVEAVLGSDIADALPQTVEVIYTDGTSEPYAVAWDTEAINAINSMGTYKIKGTVTYTVGEETKTKKVFCTVDVTPDKNLLGSDSSFESGQGKWTLEGTCFKSSWAENPRTGKNALGFNGKGIDVVSTASHTMTADETGYYAAYMYSEGADMGDGSEISIKLSNVTKGTETEAANSTLQGWNVWQKPTTADLQADEGDELKVIITVKGKSGGWGSIDDVYVYRSNYTITYELDGGTNHADNPSYYLKTDAVSFKNPTREGYVFDGWYKDSAFKKKISRINAGSSGNLTLYAKWVEIPQGSYSITYELDGGENHADNPLTYDGTEAITLKDATKEGYTFKGWYTDSAFTEANKITEIAVGRNENLILFAKFEKDGGTETTTYTITYNLDGGTNAAANPATYDGTTKITLANASKTGYTFKGWYKDSAFTEANKVTEIPVGSTGNLTLYAKFEKDGGTETTTYTITYNLDGGTNAAANPATYDGTTKITLANASKTGYTFKGWYKDSAFTEANKVTEIPVGSTGNLTLYAKFEKDGGTETTTYTITYNLDGGTNAPSNPETYDGTTKITLANASKTGYTFKGWYTDSACTEANKITEIPVGSTGNLTLYAKFEEDGGAETTYTITYNLDGGENAAANPATYDGKTAITLADASKEGYTFKGWYTDSACTEANKITVIEAGRNENLTLYAKFEKNNGSNVEDKKVTGIKLSVSSQQLMRNQTLNLTVTVEPADAKDPSITWSTSDAKVATVDQTGKVTAMAGGTAVITATANDGSGVSISCTITVPYTITYQLNGGTNNSGNPATYFNQNITLKNPTRNGYTFGGWYSDSKFKTKVTAITQSSKQDITLYAKWTLTVKAAAVKSVKNVSGKKAKVTIKKMSGAIQYKVMYSTDKKFKKNKKTKTTKKTSITLTKLKKGKTYYVKVCACKKDSSGKKVWGPYGKAKKVKIKK